MKTKLLAVFLKIFSRKIQNKNRRSQRKKRMRHNYQAKMLQEILLQSTTTYYHIVPALFSFFFKDLNALPVVLFTVAYYPFLPIQTCVWPFPKSF